MILSDEAVEREAKYGKISAVEHAASNEHQMHSAENVISVDAMHFWVVR